MKITLERILGRGMRKAVVFTFTSTLYPNAWLLTLCIQRIPDRYLSRKTKRWLLRPIGWKHSLDDYEMFVSLIPPALQFAQPVPSHCHHTSFTSCHLADMCLFVHYTFPSRFCHVLVSCLTWWVTRPSYITCMSMYEFHILVTCPLGNSSLIDQHVLDM